MYLAGIDGESSISRRIASAEYEHAPRFFRYFGSSRTTAKRPCLRALLKFVKIRVFDYRSQF